MGLSRRKFTKEFKIAALRRLDAGASIAEVTRSCEINPSLLHRWRRDFQQAPSPLTSDRFRSYPLIRCAGCQGSPPCLPFFRLRCSSHGVRCLPIASSDSTAPTHIQGGRLRGYIGDFEFRGLRACHGFCFWATLETEWVV
ncbi:MAG: transposase [Acidobacteriota bacterium]|nr:transposase [Acidobacteriota bacterium]